jgi:hypothetical protein
MAASDVRTTRIGVARRWVWEVVAYVERRKLR